MATDHFVNYKKKLRELIEEQNKWFHFGEVMRTKSFLQIDNRETIHQKYNCYMYRAGAPHTYLVKNVYYPFFIIFKCF